MVATLAPIAEALDSYIADVVAVLPLRKVYVFGSYVNGTATTDSDVDLCFFSDDMRVQQATVELVATLLGLARRYYDVALFEPHVFATSDLENDNPFVKEVVRTGIELPTV
jgi:predicted nucleotidyltransferase